MDVEMDKAFSVVFVYYTHFSIAMLEQLAASLGVTTKGTSLVTTMS